MLDLPSLSRRARAWRIVAAVAAMLVAVIGLLWSLERRITDLRDEVRWLRVRLADKRGMIARQQAEMAEVATAVDRMTRTATAVRERATQARRLAHMEESREPAYDVVAVKGTLEGAIVSEDASRTLNQLAWLDSQAAAAGDSIAVLSALLKDRPDDGRRGLPSFWPVRGSVTSRFGNRRSPYGRGREMHPGIDISARYGMPVIAGGDGKVIFAGRDSGYGALVVLDHGSNVDTFYGHLSAIYVREGQVVRRGQPLGAVGATGRATGAHLHYEVRVRGTPVDPQRYLVN